MINEYLGSQYAKTVDQYQLVLPLVQEIMLSSLLNISIRKEYFSDVSGQM